MKKQTEVMHRNLRRAVKELRAKLNLSQQDFADELNRAQADLEASRETVSRWENGKHSPSPEHRMALSRIAAKYEYEDLAAVFRASISTWQVVSHVEEWMKDEH